MNKDAIPSGNVEDVAQGGLLDKLFSVALLSYDVA